MNSIDEIIEWCATALCLTIFFCTCVVCGSSCQRDGDIARAYAEKAKYDAEIARFSK